MGKKLKILGFGGKFSKPRGDWPARPDPIWPEQQKNDPTLPLFDPDPSLGCIVKVLLRIHTKCYF